MAGTFSTKTKQGTVVPCFCFDSIGSTNDEAKRMAADGAPDVFALIAREQTGGRGRYHRGFLSARDKGAFLTFACKVPPSLDVSPLGAYSALAVADTLEEVFGVPTAFKWPNDVLVDGRKVCGILPERVHGKDGDSYVIVGVGVNLFYQPADFGELADKATSALIYFQNHEFNPAKCSADHAVSAALGFGCVQADGAEKVSAQNDSRVVVAQIVATKIAAGLCDIISDFVAGEDLTPRYRERLSTLGKLVAFTDTDGERRQGIACDITPSCALVVRCGGELRTIGWGEVTQISK